MRVARFAARASRACKDRSNGGWAGAHIYPSSPGPAGAAARSAGALPPLAGFGRRFGALPVPNICWGLDGVVCMLCMVIWHLARIGQPALKLKASTKDTSSIRIACTSSAAVFWEGNQRTATFLFPARFFCQLFWFLLVLMYPRRWSLQ